MNKKCTNPKCRKKFSTRRNISGTCPYCGKEYRQLNKNMHISTNKEDYFLIDGKYAYYPGLRSRINEALEGKQKIPAVKLFREITGKDLKYSKDYIEKNFFHA